MQKILENWLSATWDFLPKIPLAAGIVILSVILAKIAKKLCLRFYADVSKTNSEINIIIASVIYFFVVLSGVFLALQVLGLEQVLTKLLAGAGILGIIAGFAFKDIASQCICRALIEHTTSVQRWRLGTD
jgi:small conductance mechanosensitive channel